MTRLAAKVIPLICLTYAWTSYGVIKPARSRPDLSDKLSALICSGKDLNAPNAVWQFGVFDAQIAGQRIVGRNGQPLSTADLQATAQALADQNNHRGVSYGMCADGSGWVASQPSPRPIQMTTTKTLTIPATELAAECQRVRVDFAPASSGRPRPIKLPALRQVRNDLTINLNFLGDGVLSVACLPKQPAWQGNTLWGLVPIKRSPAAAAPQSAKYAPMARPDAKNFVAWINALRAKENLAPIQLSRGKAIDSATKLLASTQTIVHDRTMLLNVSKELAQAKVRFLGENRVIGANAHEMYWLLWNSPPHRDLLLSRKANSVGIAIEQQDQRYFAVLMFANEIKPKATAVPISKKPVKNKKK